MLCFTFRPGGILVCKLEGASFWEKTTGADYLPHTMTLPEGTVVKIQRCEQNVHVPSYLLYAEWCP